MVSNFKETLNILDEIEKLPSLPGVVTKIIEVVNNPKSTATDLNNIISKDQSLTSNTLKLANSAYYGFPRKISKITEAIVILGFNTVKGLALSASVCDMFKSSKEIEEFSPAKLWQHSVAVAICAELIAKKINYKDTEELFILGIIHDIGILVILQFFPDEFLKILKETKQKQQNLSKTEKEILGIDHGILGKRLSLKWKLPKLFGDVIGFHHTPNFASGESKLISSIIYLADLIIRLKKIGHDAEYIIPALNREAFMTANFKKEYIKEIAEKLDLELDKAKDFLDMINK